MSQIVYILTNEAMPDFVKIGFTTGTVEKRIQELDRTGVPLPFEVYYAANVADARKEEEWLHSIFDDRRARKTREFFKINPELVTLALKRVELSEIKVKADLTPEQEKEIGVVKERRSRFRFANYGIPVGATLTYTRDPSVTAIVVEGDKIMIGEKVDSLSNHARVLLGYRLPPQGPLYFRYEGEILDDRRKRLG